MPGMDGFETAAHIKRRERTRDIPIIFLTAINHGPHHTFRGYAAGAVDYISKPFDPWVLRAKVSVFVELYMKNCQLREQAALLRLSWRAAAGAGERGVRGAARRAVRAAGRGRGAGRGAVQAARRVARTRRRSPPRPIWSANSPAAPGAGSRLAAGPRQRPRCDCRSRVHDGTGRDTSGEAACARVSLRSAVIVVPWPHVASGKGTRTPQRAPKQRAGPTRRREEAARSGRRRPPRSRAAAPRRRPAKKRPRRRPARSRRLPTGGVYRLVRGLLAGARARRRRRCSAA